MPEEQEIVEGQVKDKPGAAVVEPETDPEPDEAGDEPEVEETPEDKAHRLELENERLKGQLEASTAAPEPEAADPLKAVDSEIAEAEAELEKLDADEFDTPEDLARKSLQAAKLTRKLSTLERKRDGMAAQQADEEAQREADAEAHQGTLKAVMNRPEVKLPPSAINELDRRVRERFDREGFTQGRPPSRAHYEAVVEAEALKLKAGVKVKAKPRAAPPRPSAGGGTGAPEGQQIQPGRKGDVLRQMREAGLT
jgi:hypothetical protein